MVSFLLPSSFFCCRRQLKTLANEVVGEGGGQRKCTAATATALPFLRDLAEGLFLINYIQQKILHSTKEKERERENGVRLRVKTK